MAKNKESIHLDLSTVRFLKSEVEELEKVKLLKDYFSNKRDEIGEGGMMVEKHGVQAKFLNGRNLTNAGTYRAYCAEYLKAHPSIHQKA